MNMHVLSAPVAGQVSTLVYTPEEALELHFDANAATFARDGGNLILTFANGGQIVVPGFFEGGSLPSITLPDGTTLNSGDFLKSMNPDMEIETAAGPAVAAHSADSSGTGEYADGAGELLGGVDRLGSLGTDQWTMNAPEAELPLAAGTALSGAVSGAGTDNAGTDGSGNGGSTEPVGYIARAVLYQTKDGATDTVRFYLMDADGRPVKAEGGELDGNAPVSANGLIDTDAIIRNADGSFSFGLSEAGKAALADALAAAGGDYAKAANLFDYITFTYDGRAYTMQVVINASGSYVPSDADADRAPAAAFYGEWHSETTGTGQGSRETGAGNDEVWLDNGTATAMHGGSRETGAGDDAVHAKGSIRADVAGQSNAVHLGSGDNSLDVSQHLWAQSGGVNAVTAGNGTDSVDIKGWVFASQGGKNTVDTGAGENDLLHVGSRVYAEYDGSSNSLKTGGTLKADADVYAANNGMNALESGATLAVGTNVEAGTGGQNGLSGGDVTVGGYVYANTAHNTLESKGDMTVGGLVDAWYTGSNSLKSGGDMTVGGRVYAVNGENTLESDGRLTVKGNVESWYANGKNTLTGDTDVEIGGAVNARKGGENTVTAENTLTVKGQVYADSDATNGAGKNTLRAEGDITVGNGVMATQAGAKNTFESKGDVTLNAADNALAAMYGGSGAVDAEGNVVINAVGTGTGETDAVYSYDTGSSIVVNAGEGITVNATGSATNSRAIAVHGMNGGDVTLTAHAGDIELNATSADGKSAWGIYGSKVLSLNAEDGDVRMDINGGNEAVGIYGTADIKAKNTVDIQVDATSGIITSGAYGAQGLHVHGQSGVTIDAADVSIRAGNTGGDAAAIYTYDRSNAGITASGHVDLAAASGGAGIAYGMRIDRPNAGKTTGTTVKGDTVSVTADGSASTGNTFAMHAKGVNYDINATAAEKSSQLYAATNKIVAAGEGEAVKITAVGGTGSVTGMYAGGGDTSWGTDITAANKISSAGSVTVEAGGERSFMARGLDAFMNAGNFIDAADGVTVNVDGWRQSLGLAAGGGYGGALNKVNAGGDITINAGTQAGTLYAVGVQATDWAVNDLKAKGDIIINADAQLRNPNYDVESRGVQVMYKGVNKLSAEGDITITATTETARGGTRGVFADTGANTLTAAGAVTITAEGGHYGRGVEAFQPGAVNTIKGNGVTITSITSQDAVGVGASSQGKNTITSTGDLSITAGRPGAVANGTDIGDRAMGVWAFLNGSNTLEAKGAVDITAQYGYTTSGVRAEGCANTVTGGSVAISAVGGTNTSYGMAAKDGGTNLVKGHVGLGVVVTITATAGATGQALALWANGGGSVNRIQGSSVTNTADVISLVGGMHAGNGGVNLVQTGSGRDTVSVTGDITGSGNRIETGAGDDVISLHGHVQAGALTIIAGSGDHDTLVLIAPDADSFRHYYEGWLQDLGGKGMIDSMGIDAVTVRLDDAAGVNADLGDLGWLHSYLPNLTQVETGAGDDVLRLGTVADLTVLMGDGDDWLSLDAASLGNVLDGGAGHDVLHLTVDGQSDVAGQAESFFGQNTISGFESVLLDMTNGGRDTLSIDQLLGNGLPGGADLFIKGDQADQIVSSGTWTVDESSVVTVGGTDYHAWTNEDAQTVYMEIGLSFM
ncbi:hypothetical protein KL86DPRO_11786 [uncultured delta proteobacterium]|uniref:Uncharacterized protein n=1 Tax=uncultured delta proteobacterium TaxID=34034 RepID=A0A212JM07_9DELT|nr:hypothetical protein KL86DPRO_11786 [uncultured delta proteobacterium]